ncbi:cation diffusion facilitator family transporter [Rhodanobacter denitrificans]|uniref:cation diffusion facilitator family transporter n=1 Tax=Rhodanobacter denitrificans TaxID=666685 RepID=UPI0023AEAC9F|nr:cation transporter [Rhodanobacter denitrificans]
MSAQANGLTLLLLSVWFIVEAIRRLINPPVVEGLLVTVIAVIGIGVNLLAVWAMSKANRQSLIAALVAAGLMLKAGIGLVRDSGRIFLEAAPRGLDPASIAEAIRAVPAVTRLNDLHVWEVTSGMPALSVHIHVNHDIDCHDVRRGIEAMLHDRFAITHTTLQTDHATTDESAHTVGCTFSSPGAAQTNISGQYRGL